MLGRSFVERAHRALSGDRGAAIAAAHVARNAVVTMPASGNIAGRS
jgi:hypothetical protein